MSEITEREKKWEHLEQASQSVAKWPNWKLKAAGICHCTFSKKILGDGCEICNPEMAREIAEENERDKHLFPNECPACGRPKTNNICVVCCEKSGIKTEQDSQDIENKI